MSLHKSQATTLLHPPPPPRPQSSSSTTASPVCTTIIDDHQKDGDENEEDEEEEELTTEVGSLDGTRSSDIYYHSLNIIVLSRTMNRKANCEEIRRAEVAASELGRQQMKVLEAGAAVRLDPSARVKINPELTCEARLLTPSQAAKPSASGTPSSSTASSAITNNATKEKTQLSKFEELVASQVHVDINIVDS
ncbi:uncharacterized protein PGTG_05114 [Puccinia graminis f. sp. tritici CRL 75-36-700-3]|uniref:Uncharacterized protein n=1 Tax=Puccinia graminis f. sp. tritici (strain CRL 75-36-700-3 / race SCCL) TaxID=418459 RepID=E3K6G7_PUCGT|nr:uncharacterized protein PGTG_05114 [Puccinia graminis f. sp. tritici CRL 75-36-700-3]EFP79889.1 hypothetical protein PGTG_05114 [Puccinia graminis f. sp. tritici CRL 75-36-700-3]